MSASRVIPVVGSLLIAWCIFSFFFKKFNSTVRKGTFSIIDNTVWALLLNTVLFTLLFWNVAFPFALGVGGVFIAVIRNDLKRAFEEERIGMFGMNEEMRLLGGEAYNDLSIEEQLAYKEKVKPYKFDWWAFLLLVVVLPFLIMLLLEQLGLGDYLFETLYFDVAQFKTKWFPAKEYLMNL